MEVEYDPLKSELNAIKHNIDFETAKTLWDDGDRIIIPARSDSEERYAILAQQDRQIWIGFFTLRTGSIRIISVRRARDNERQLYDSRGTR